MLEFYSPVDSFPNDNIPRRIDWFGEVTKNSFKESDPNIEVIMSPFVGSLKDPSHIRAVDSARQAAFSIAVGLLPMLHIGSIWRQQLPLPISNYQYRSETFEDIAISPDTVRTVHAGHTLNGSPLIPKNYHHIGTAAGQAAKCLAIEHKGDPYSIIIPCVEIIRSFYGISTALAKAMFKGALDDPAALYHRDKTGFVENTSKFILTLKGGITIDEAKALAPIVASPDIVAPYARLIHGSLIKCQSAGTFAVPETFLPFQGKATFSVYGKWMRSGERWRFLVFWIDKCDFRYPFTSIELAWDPPSPSVEIETGGRSPAPGKTSYKRTRQRKRSQGQRFINNKEPNKRAARIRHEINSACFLGFNDIEMTVVKQGQTLVIKRARRELKDVPELQLSTGDGRYNRTKIEGLDVLMRLEKPNDPVPFCPDLFKKIHEVLEALRDIGEKQGKNIDYEVIGASDNLTETQEHVIGLLTRFPTEYKEAGVLKEVPWSYIYYRDYRRRLAMIAKISYEGRYFYLFESEHRMKREEEELKKKEHYTTLVVHGEDFRHLDNTFLQTVLLLCAENEGTWLDDDQMPELKRRKFKHAWKTPKQLAEHLLGYMGTAIKEAPSITGLDGGSPV